MSGHIRHLSISHSHMFLLNSRLDHFSAPCCQGPLIPKLRGQFAEFLSHDSLEHLRILSSPTCVGLRYGLYKDSRFEVFLGSLFTASVRAPEGLRYCQISASVALNHRIYLRPLTDYSVSPRACHCSVSPNHLYTGNGILTICPSNFPFGLSLGPDLP